MKTIWLIFMAFVIARLVWRLWARIRDRGGKGTGGYPYPFPTPEDLPAGNEPGAEPGQRGRKLNIPEYLTRRSDDVTTVTPVPPQEKSTPVVEGGLHTASQPARDIQPLQPATRECTSRAPVALPESTREEGDTHVCREPRRRRDQAGAADELICPGEYMKGVAWSQILGPRGGLRAQKRSS